MRLIASLTTLSAAALLVTTMSGCAGNTPRKPASADDKSRTSAFDDNCLDARSRGAPAPVGCPQTVDDRRRPRTVPSVDAGQMPLPNLPGRDGVGGVLGR